MLLKNGDRFLIIGDSITDAGRHRMDDARGIDRIRSLRERLVAWYLGRSHDPEGLGFGYVRILHDLLWVKYPELLIEIVNRGIGGDTIRHLEARWDRDVIDIEPDVLAISIGVNDVWRQLQEPCNPEEVLLEEFEATYRRLLVKIREKVGCSLVLCETSIIGEQVDTPHNVILKGYNACIARLAEEFNALLVPMNQAFWRVIGADPSRVWTQDGVHPLSHGHMLMAETMLSVLEKA